MTGIPSETERKHSMNEQKLTRKQIEARGRAKRRRKLRAKLEKYYADSRLDKAEQRRRVQWDLDRGRG